MKKFTLLFSFVTFAFFSSYGQLAISVEKADGTDWNAFVNAWNVSDDTYAFGFAYNLPTQKVEFNGTTVTVKPNYGIWVDAATDPAWFDTPGTPPSNPNKNIEALSYLQVERAVNSEYFTQDVVFSGNVNSFTIDSSYEVKAYIIVFPADFSQNRRYEVTITETGAFTLTRPEADVDANFTEAFMQYGFIVHGLPADPALEATLGSVVFQSDVLSTVEFSKTSFKTYPNPAQDDWEIETQNIEISAIDVYDISGKNVLSIAPKSSKATIEGANLTTGLYFAEIRTPSGTETVKLLKR